MITYKCKMCGGSLNPTPNETVCTCEYCGSMQTLPRISDEKKQRLYERAEKYRINNDFDNAIAVYEQIIFEDKTDAESYWSILLCKYGIVYVERPSGKTRVPTINRLQFESIFDDENYIAALKYADPFQKEVYINEANRISRIQKGVLEVSSREEPFDVFICYKEKDQNGERTVDSVIAQELYNELVRSGINVFFARITLEEKLGIDYEPYIFAALNSAPVMVVIGTKQEYFNAPWVKNEWSRYLALIKNGAEKTLVPAYKDMNASDMPSEFLYLQAQDLSKIGAVQDLVYGIEKIVGRKQTKNTYSKDTDKENDYLTALKFMNTANNAEEYLYASGLFSKLGNYKDSLVIALECKQKAEICETSDSVALGLRKYLRIALAVILILSLVGVIGITADMYMDPESSLASSVFGAFTIVFFCNIAAVYFVSSTLKRIKNRIAINKGVFVSIIIAFMTFLFFIMTLVSAFDGEFTPATRFGFFGIFAANLVSLITKFNVLSNIKDYNRSKI